MKKVFFALLFLVLIGAVVLWWLMQAMPNTSPHTEAIAPKESTAGEHLPEGEEVADGSRDVQGKNEEAEVSEHGAEAHEAKSHDTSPVVEEAKLMITTEPVSAKVRVDGEEKGETPMVLALGAKTQKVELEAEGFEIYSKVAPSKKDLEDASSQLNWRVELRARKGALIESPRAQPSVAKIETAEHKTASGAHKLEKVPHKAEATAHMTESAVHKVESHNSTPVQKVEAVHASTAPAGAPELMAQGVVGPFFVQVRSLPNESPEELSTVKNQIEEYRGQLKKKVIGCSVNLSSKGKWVRILVGPYAKKVMAQESLRQIQGLFTEPLIVTGAQSCLPSL